MHLRVQVQVHPGWPLQRGIWRNCKCTPTWALPPLAGRAVPPAAPRALRALGAPLGLLWGTTKRVHLQADTCCWAAGQRNHHVTLCQHIFEYPDPKSIDDIPFTHCSSTRLSRDTVCHDLTGHPNQDDSSCLSSADEAISRANVAVEQRNPMTGTARHAQRRGRACSSETRASAPGHARGCQCTCCAEVHGKRLGHNH